MKTTSGYTSSDTRAVAIRDRPHPLQATFAQGGFDDLPVAVLCFDRIDVDGDPFLAPIRAGVDVASASDTIVGCETSQAALLLRAFATTRNVAVANAARMVVNRETEIDTDATTRWSPRPEHPSTGPTQIESRQLESPVRLGQLHKIYGEHSAAVYGCAAFICGADATMVTVEAFVTFWHQPDSARINPTNVRIRLVAIAHRLAMRAAMSMVPSGDDSTMPSADANAVLSRGQDALEARSNQRPPPRNKGVIHVR